MYSHGRPGRGRGSSFVSDRPWSARMFRQRSSAPRSWRVVRIRLVLHGMRGSKCAGVRERATKRVWFSVWFETLDCKTTSPYASAASAGPIAAASGSPASATAFIASAVSK
jgi:hypothetical protein